MPGKSSATVVQAADAAGIAAATALLHAGQPVAVPTETVYGLAARADRAEAVAAIYRAKGRPSFNPLIVHVSGVDQAEAIAEFDDRAHCLARHFWPGALTMVLPLSLTASGRTPMLTVAVSHNVWLGLGRQTW